MPRRRERPAADAAGGPGPQAEAPRRKRGRPRRVQVPEPNQQRRLSRGIDNEATKRRLRAAGLGSDSSDLSDLESEDDDCLSDKREETEVEALLGLD